MEKDILNYSSTVMFRGTPCIYISVVKPVTDVATSSLQYMILMDLHFTDVARLG